MSHTITGTLSKSFYLKHMIAPTPLSIPKEVKTRANMLRNLKLLIVLAWTLSCAPQASVSVLEKALAEAGGEQSDLSSVYRVALRWYDAQQQDALEVFQHLADENNHIMSAVKLGHHYIEKEVDPQKAVHYFGFAGENGPHHASLFNAGRILAEMADWVGALAYLRAAATLSQSYPPEYINKETTESALRAYDIVSRQVSREELSVMQVGDLFIYGSLQDNLDEEAHALWGKAINGLLEFNETFVDSDGKSQSQQAMETVALSLRSLWETYGSNGTLSELQTYLLLYNMNDMLGPLAGLDDEYLAMAGGYTEALATMSLYCYEHVATAEDDSACFNGAAASAMSFYRRSSDMESAKRILKVANEHPTAATKWTRIEQTPRVFHTEIASKPWWNAEDFSVVQSLTKAFQQSPERILEELNAVKALQEGSLRGPNNAVDISGKNGGFQRLFIPFIGVRTEKASTSTAGAGGWAEFGPLFDGVSWNEDTCKIVPTICQAIRNDPSLCTARGGAESSKNIWQLCGADTVVTILRLRPGTTILPHCGTTNARLIMHFALEGAENVEFTVGGEMVKSYNGGDGHAIVFDDSFEHTVYNGGDQDRFVVLAVLAHPDLE